MNSQTNPEIFQEKGFIFCPELLNVEVADEVSNELQRLIDEGHSKKDWMCPLSHSINGAPVLDSLLEQLTPIFSEITGLALYPSFCYARKYAKGDELKIHTDRPACEITATINLKFKGEQWPIYVGTKKDKSDALKVDMNVGDALLFRGLDIPHWREKYTEGEWQFQVFVHYVNAKGPHAEWKYDKKGKLLHHEENNSLLTVYSSINKAFSSESCDKIIKQCEAQSLEKCLVGNEVRTFQKTVRDSKKLELPNDIGIGATLTGIGFQANAYKWKFNVTESNQTEFLKYDKNGHFSSHIDTFLLDVDNTKSRKISVILFLNDDFEGGKFFIDEGYGKFYPKQQKGDIVVFPSFLLHGVEPVTSGIRRSLITWLVGPYFK